MTKDKQLDQCDQMRYNCCTSGDLSKINEIWDEYEKKLELNYNYLKFYLIEIFKYHKDYKLMAERIQEYETHRQCKKITQLVIESDVDEDEVEEIKSMLDKVYKFDKNMKKGLTCFLCDFDNSPHFDTENKIINMDNEICLELVNNTVPFSKYMNKFVKRYINTINFLAHCASRKTSEIGDFILDEKKSFDFLTVQNSLYYEACL